MAEKITEEMGIHKQWYEEARKMTPDALPEFIRKITQDYEHDYGTICHACAAAAVAASWAVDKSPQGGITGFQAGAIMWEFIKHWNGVDGPARLVQYEDLLFPQYENRFRSISKETWEHVRADAQRKLQTADTQVHPDVWAHWQSVAAGNVPFGLSVEQH